MKRDVTLVRAQRLKSHEAVLPKRVRKLVERIRCDGFLRNPLIVDRKSLVILDGHHRFVALQALGALRIPVQLVDYRSPEIRVYLRRKEFLFPIIKRAVVREAILGNLFPNKTTRHYFDHRIRNVHVTLESLLVSNNRV